MHIFAESQSFHSWTPIPVRKTDMNFAQPLIAASFVIFALRRWPPVAKREDGVKKHLK